MALEFVSRTGQDYEIINNYGKTTHCLYYGNSLILLTNLFSRSVCRSFTAVAAAAVVVVAAAAAAVVVEVVVCFALHTWET